MKSNTQVNFDAAFLTLEEAETIFRVLERDEILRHVEKNRIETMKEMSENPDDKKKQDFKIFTGEWIEYFTDRGRKFLNSASEALREIVSVRISTSSTRNTHTDRTTTEETITAEGRATRGGVGNDESTLISSGGVSGRELEGDARLIIDSDGVSGREFEDSSRIIVSSGGTVYGREIGETSERAAFHEDPELLDEAIEAVDSGQGHPKVHKIVKKFVKKIPAKQQADPQKFGVNIEISQHGSKAQGAVLMHEEVPKEYLFDLPPFQQKFKGIKTKEGIQPTKFKCKHDKVPQEFVFELHEKHGHDVMKEKHGHNMAKGVLEEAGQFLKYHTVPNEYIFELEEGCGRINGVGEKPHHKHETEQNISKLAGKSAPKSARQKLRHNHIPVQYVFNLEEDIQGMIKRKPMKNEEVVIKGVEVAHRHHHHHPHRRQRPKAPQKSLKHGEIIIREVQQGREKNCDVSQRDIVIREIQQGQASKTHQRMPSKKPKDVPRQAAKAISIPGSNVGKNRKVVIRGAKDVVAKYGIVEKMTKRAVVQDGKKVAAKSGEKDIFKKYIVEEYVDDESTEKKVGISKSEVKADLTKFKTKQPGFHHRVQGEEGTKKEIGKVLHDQKPPLIVVSQHDRKHLDSTDDVVGAMWDMSQRDDVKS